MKIIWVWNGNRAGQSYHNENDKALFQKHDECMRRFRLDHPKVETTKPEDVKRAEWLTLVPMGKVELARYLQN